MNTLKKFGLLLLIVGNMVNCTGNKPELSITDFGVIDGQKVQLYTIEFDQKLKVKLTNYGAIITALHVPDRNGKLDNVVLGYETLDGYLEATPYFGAVVGRYGNRIANGKFTLDDMEYELATNNGPNHLHGGIKGFDKVVWEVIDSQVDKEKVTLKMKYVSEDGEEGYPGQLTTTLTYTFSANEWRVDYSATTDKKTIVNLTQHAYFNLSAGTEHILGHELQLDAEGYIPIDSTLIPTGEIQSVVNTPFDFTTSKKIGEDIELDDLQLKYGLGYDHCWALNGGKTVQVRKVAELYHEASGRLLEIKTTEPGIQFYSGNFLDGSITGSGGVQYKHRHGLALETQHFPDAPNQPHFPSVVLEVGDTYQSSTVMSFSTK